MKEIKGAREVERKNRGHPIFPLYFVEDTKQKLGMKAHGREVIGGDGTYQLREATEPYGCTFGPKNDDLRLENRYF